MHKGQISVKEYFSSRKGIRKLAREVNFYFGKDSSLELIFDNEQVKPSDLIYFLKRIRVSFAEFCDVIKVVEFDEFIILDIAHEILRRRKFFNFRNMIIGASLSVAIFLGFLFTKWISDNWKFFYDVSVVKGKINRLIDYHQERQNLIAYYKKSNIMLSNYNRNLDSTMDDLSYNIVKNCQKFGLPEDLLISLIYNESSFSKFAKSNIHLRDRIDNAFGFCQIYFTVWKDVLVNIDNADLLYETDYNIYWGSFILKYYFDKNSGDIYKTLMNYNGGRKKQDSETTIVNTETFEYIKKIINEMSILSKIK